jgi:capsular polysaccharide biosynthesis protein
MELKDIVRFINNNIKIILGSGFLLALLGMAAYFLIPDRYYSEGSFYIHREVEVGVEGHFTYEGYYGQQTAMAYTNTVIALFDNINIKQMVLRELDIAATERNLRELDRKLRTKKPAPQLIVLTIKANSPDEAEKVWRSFSNNTINTAQILNASGDPLLQITQLEGPVTKTGYKNILVNIFGGFAVGLLAGIFVSAVVSYKKEGR